MPPPTIATSHSDKGGRSGTGYFPGRSFDFRDMLGANAKGGFPYTPTLQLIYGLKESLDMLFEEGLDNVFARHHRIAEGV